VQRGGESPIAAVSEPKEGGGAVAGQAVAEKPAEETLEDLHAM